MLVWGAGRGEKRGDRTGFLLLGCEVYAPACQESWEIKLQSCFTRRNKPHVARLGRMWGEGFLFGRAHAMS